MKNKSIKIFNSFYIICCVALISINYVSAQENNIYEIKRDINSSSDNTNFSSDSKKLNSKNSSSFKTKSEKDNRKDFYELAFKMHPTAYSKNNSIKNIYGSGKIKKLTFEDTKSFGLLSKYKDVELITVKVKSASDLNNVLDLSNNININKLKYVFIKCGFKCSRSQIKKFVKTNSNVRVFYLTENPS